MPTDASKLPQPVTLGLKKSFGFGDRLGLATPGHIVANNHYDFAPIFAQQSIREMQRTNRSPEEVMSAAQKALQAVEYAKPWGADADHLKTPQDVDRTLAAGFCFFTIDPSAFVVNEADTMSERQLADAVAKMVSDGIFAPDWSAEYLRGSWDLGGNAVRFTVETLHRAAVKYGRAIAHSATMGQHIAKVSGGKPFEIEISVDETDSPTSPAEHLFFGLELKRRGVPNVVSLAPRFIGDMEKGIDYRGDLKAFETALRMHVAIARFCGPYKISIHSGSDKFSIYPIIGRLCGDLLHVKTAGTSYLEALRVVCRTDAALFGEIADYCHGRFDTDRASYHISTTQAQVNALPRRGSTAELERVYLDEIPGRQLMHVTFGSVLTAGKRSNGQPLKDALLDVVRKNEALHTEVLVSHFDKHLRLLNAG